MKKKTTKKLTFPNKDEILGSHYYHIDNGGITVSVRKEYLNDDLRYPNDHSIKLKFEFQHMCTSSVIETIDVCPYGLRKFAEVLIKAAKKIESERKWN
jgi:hypothetical protein